MCLLRCHFPLRPLAQARSSDANLRGVQHAAGAMQEKESERGASGRQAVTHNTVDVEETAADKIRRIENLVNDLQKHSEDFDGVPVCEEAAWTIEELLRDINNMRDAALLKDRRVIAALAKVEDSVDGRTAQALDEAVEEARRQKAKNPPTLGKWTVTQTWSCLSGGMLFSVTTDDSHIVAKIDESVVLEGSRKTSQTREIAAGLAAMSQALRNTMGKP